MESPKLEEIWSVYVPQLCPYISCEDDQDATCEFSKDISGFEYLKIELCGKKSGPN